MLKKIVKPKPVALAMKEKKTVRIVVRIFFSYYYIY